MENKEVLEANEAIKKLLAQTALERDIIWGYLEDFKTIHKALKDRYENSLDPHERLRKADIVLKYLDELYNTYIKKAE